MSFSNQTKCQQLATSAGLGIWEYKIESGSANFSATFKQLIKLSNSEALTWHQFKNIIHSDDREIFDAFFDSHIASNTPLELELRLVVDGKACWYKLRGYKQSGDSPYHGLVLGYIVDYGLEKEILNELGKTMEAKELALSAGKIGTWSAVPINENEWRWHWDTRANKIFKLEPSDIGNIQTWIDTLHTEDKDRVVNALTLSLTKGIDFEESYRAVLKNDELIYVYAKGVCKRKGHGKIVSIDGICIEQTQEYAIQNELRKLNTELEARVKDRTKQLEQACLQAEQASQTKSDFLSMMSHELRTPMNAIIGSLDLLNQSQLDYESQDLIETAVTSANNLVYILNDILDLNKIEAGKMELEIVPFSISEIIDNVIKVFLPETAKKGIILDVREDPKIPLLVDGDPVRIRQILFNLIGNAIKFTETTDSTLGKVVLDARILSVEGSIFLVSFSIKDNGIGIDKATQKKLFSPFIQAERSTTRKYGGTGLGLAICGKLTDIMGGAIHLESELDLGSTFTLELPLWKTNEYDKVPRFKQASFYLVNLNPYLNKLENRLGLYIEAEGGDVRHTSYDDLMKNLANTGDLATIILLAGEVLEFESEISNLNQLAKKNNRKLLLIIDKTQKTLAKQKFSNLDIIPIKPATRAQLISSIEKSLVKINSGYEEIDLEEFDLGLDLDTELLNPTPSKSEQQNNEIVNDVTDILIVEDNPLNQKLIAKQMEKIGFSYKIANDGIEGLNIWQQYKFKLILTDCHMPNLNGYEMTSKIREIELEANQAQIPIVALTGAAMTGEKSHCLSIGMNGFLSKPVQMKELESTLNQWLK
ncbi:PAS domain-containing hybrid sensor histidine kinase/response regulator [Catenovulum maritimum]|uniref:histidine kinase n=1 Tax=Catenovulum maritimum TaxID=1513271 RepID=A0A0J8GU16_9ALTE|nr:PAS domain-containing hybrid sensor histidine kinase/response regulator [Catenovulum maritimum]KMT66237.1 hypothetical protein XM47_04370 [Catenovulum maritimum]